MRTSLIPLTTCTDGSLGRKWRPVRSGVLWGRAHSEGKKTFSTLQIQMRNAAQTTLPHNNACQWARRLSGQLFLTEILADLEGGFKRWFSLLCHRRDIVSTFLSILFKKKGERTDPETTLHCKDGLDLGGLKGDNVLSIDDSDSYCLSAGKG